MSLACTVAKRGGRPNARKPIASVTLNRNNGAPPNAHSLNSISTATSNPNSCAWHVNKEFDVLYNEPVGLELPFSLPEPLCVHNTFISTPVKIPPSLGGFYQPRRTRSWPSIEIDKADIDIVVSDNAEAGFFTSKQVDDDDINQVSPVSTSAQAMTNAPWRRNAVDDRGTAAQVAGKDGRSSSSEGSNYLEIPAPQAEAVLWFPDRWETHFLGSDELPSRGSSSHHIKKCKPCAFLVKACRNGVECPFCHLCEPTEKRRRKKEKDEVRRAIRARFASHPSVANSNRVNGMPFFPGLVRPSMAAPSQEHRYSWPQSSRYC